MEAAVKIKIRNLFRAPLSFAHYILRITGFADAESSFSLRMVWDCSRRTGCRVLGIFSIELHRRDIVLLKQIQAFFGVGTLCEKMGRQSSNKYIYIYLYVFIIIYVYIIIKTMFSLSRT